MPCRGHIENGVVVRDEPRESLSEVKQHLRQARKLGPEA